MTKAPEVAARSAVFEPQESSPRRGRSVPRTVWTVVAFVVLYVVGGLLRPELFSLQNVVVTATFASILAVASFGQTVAVIQAGIDLSVPNVIAFSALSYMTWSSQFGPVLALFMSLAMGLVVGFINGVVISKLGLTPIVTTIAMNGLLFGVMLLSLTLSEFTDVPPLLQSFTSQKFDLFGLSIAWILPLTIALMLVLQFVLSYTGWGRGLYVLGSAPAAARLAGLAVDRARITGYMLSGLLGSFAGLVILGYYKQAEPFMGASFLLGSVAAVVVGGASVFGGRGSVIGTFFGALVLIQVNNLVFLLNLGTNFQNLIYGVIVLVVVAAYGRSKLLK